MLFSLIKINSGPNFDSGPYLSQSLTSTVDLNLTVALTSTVDPNFAIHWTLTSTLDTIVSTVDPSFDSGPKLRQWSLASTLVGIGP